MKHVTGLDLNEAQSNESGRILAAAAIALAVGMGLVGLRNPIVAAAPRVATLYELAGLKTNLAGLELARVSARTVLDGDRRVLLVEGDVVNRTEQTRPARGMNVSVLGSDGATLYSWNVATPRQSLAAGEQAAFVARLASPPTAGEQIAIEFNRSQETAAPGRRGDDRKNRNPMVQGSRTESQ